MHVQCSKQQSVRMYCTRHNWSGTQEGKDRKESSCKTEISILLFSLLIYMLFFAHKLLQDTDDCAIECISPAHAKQSRKNIKWMQNLTHSISTFNSCISRDMAPILYKKNTLNCDWNRNIYVSMLPLHVKLHWQSTWICDAVFLFQDQEWQSSWRSLFWFRVCYGLESFFCDLLGELNNCTLNSCSNNQ